MRNKKPKLGQKALFKAGGLSNQPTGGSEQKTPQESRDVVYELTKENIKKFRDELTKKQSHIRFSNKESKEYDRNKFRGRTIVEATRTENLRSPDNFQATKKVQKGEKLVLTGDFKVLQFEENNSKRVYWEVLTKTGDKLYILGESINPIKTISENKDTIDEMTSNGLSVLQASEIDKVRPKTDANKETPEATKQKPETTNILDRAKAGLKDAYNNRDEIYKKMDEAQGEYVKTSAYQNKSAAEIFKDRVTQTERSIKESPSTNLSSVQKSYFADRETFKTILDQRQLSTEAMQSFYNVEKYGLTIDKIANMMSDGKFSVDEMLEATISQQDHEYTRLENSFNRTENGKEYSEDIKKLSENRDAFETKLRKLKVESDNAKSPSERTEIQKTILKTQEEANENSKKLTEIQNKREQELKTYVKENYTKENFGKTQSLTSKYLYITRGMMEAKNVDPAEIDYRFEKLNALLKFKEAMLTTRVNVPEARYISPDSVKEASYEKGFEANLTKQVEEYAKNNKISSEELSKIMDIINDEPLQLLATLTYTEGSLQNLFAQEIVSVAKDGSVIDLKLNFNKDAAKRINIKSLVEGLRIQEEYGSFGDASPSNLTEANNYLQNKLKVSDKLRSISYTATLKDALLEGNGKGHKLVESHLTRIFDTNNTGKFIVEEGFFDNKYRTVTGAETAGRKSIMTQRASNSLQESTSELSAYQDFRNDLLAYNEKGELQLSPKKFVTKIKELKQKALGILPLYFANRGDLNAKQQAELTTKFIEASSKLEKLNPESTTLINDLSENLSDEMVQLIRIGLDYENIRLKSDEKFKEKANQKLSAAGIEGKDFNSTYAAIARSMMFIRENDGYGKISSVNGGVATGGDIVVGDGWTLSAAGGAYLLKNPGISGGINLELKPLDKVRFNISGGAAAFAGDKPLNELISLGLNAEVGVDLAKNTTLSAGVGANFLNFGGVPVYVRASHKFDRFSEDVSERFDKGLERITPKGQKLSKETIQLLQSAKTNPLEAKDYQKITTELKMEEAISSQKNLSEAEKAQLRETLVKTLVQRLENTSIKDAEKWNIGLSLTAGIILGTNIPFIIPAITFEMPGRTEVQTLISNTQLTEQQLKATLLEAKKEFPESKAITISSHGRILTLNEKGQQVLLQNTESLSELDSNPNNTELLNRLREQTGLTFKQELPGSYNVSIDKLKTTNDKVQKSEQVEVYLDADIKKAISISAGANGEFKLRAYKNKIPANLVILKETITDPHLTSGKNTITRISFTTKENYLTGREIESYRSGGEKMVFGPNGEMIQKGPIETGGSLQLSKLEKGERSGLKFVETFQKSDLEKYAALSQKSQEIFTTKNRLQESYKPSPEVQAALSKLGGEEQADLVKQIAELTTFQLEKGANPNFEKAFELIKKQTGETLKRREDIIYILGSLQPGYYRDINSVKPQERIARITKNAEEYTKKHIEGLCNFYFKQSGEKFTPAEQNTIINTLVELNKPSSKEMQEALTKDKVETVELKGKEGFTILTTAHRGKLEGLRQMIVSKEVKTEIVKGSYQDIDKISDPNAKQLVKRFLQSVNNPITNIENLDSRNTFDQLSQKEQADMIQTLNSRTAKSLFSIPVGKTKINGKEQIVTMASLLYGEKNQNLNTLYSNGEIQADKLDTNLLNDPEKFKTIKEFTKLIQQVHSASGPIKLEDINGNELTIELKLEAGVIHLGKCANPSYIFNQGLSLKTSYNKYQLNAASARAKNLYNEGKAIRDFNSATLGFTVSGKAKPEPTKPRKDGGEIPGGGGGGGGGEKPRKTGTEIPTTSQPEQTPTDPTRSSRADRAQSRNN